MNRFILASVLLVACVPNLSPPERSRTDEGGAPERGGTLHLASFGDVRALDPAIASDKLAGQIVLQLYAGLVDFDHDGKIVPDLAERFSVSGDRKTFLFSLRTGAAFHDGSEVTAEDIRRSMHRALHPKTPNPSTSQYLSLKGLSTFLRGEADSISGIRVLGRYAIAFDLDAPDAAFLPLLAMHPVRPVCPSGGDFVRDDFVACGAGPFRLASFERGTTIRLVRHQGYYRPELPYLDEVHVALSVPAYGQRYRFEAGQLDLVRELTQPDAARFMRDPRWAPFGMSEPPRAIGGFAMNTEVFPFSNRHVRRAVSYAIDREQIAALKPTNVKPLTELLPPTLSEHRMRGPCQRHDLSQAKAELARGGLPQGVVVTLPVYAQSFDENVAQLVREQLRKVGVTLELETMSYAAFLSRTHRRKAVAISPQGWAMDYPDASNFFDPIFSSESIGESSYNTSFYQNPELDRLLAQARRADPDLRKELYARANEILCEEAPWAFTYSYHYYEVRQPTLHGYTPHPVWSANITRAWKEKPPSYARLHEAQLYGQFLLGLSRKRGLL